MSEYMAEYERNRKWLEDRDWDCHIWAEEATFLEAFDKGRAHERTLAFGAIRRAAEVMREYEALGWRASQHGPRVNDLSAVVAEVAIRRAIRAAIGSPKA